MSVTVMVSMYSLAIGEYLIIDTPPAQMGRALALSKQTSSLFVVLVVCAGCAGPGASGKRDLHQPGVVDAETPAEQKLLTLLPTLPSGSSQAIEGVDVLPEEPYWSGSGRFCRWVQVSSKGIAHRKLACAQESGWAWVPDVFGTPRPAASLGASLGEF